MKSPSLRDISSGAASSAKPGGQRPRAAKCILSRFCSFDNGRPEATWATVSLRCKIILSLSFSRCLLLDISGSVFTIFLGASAPLSDESSTISDFTDDKHIEEAIGAGAAVTVAVGGGLVEGGVRDNPHAITSSPKFSGIRGGDGVSGISGKVSGICIIVPNSVLCEDGVVGLRGDEDVSTPSSMGCVSHGVDSTVVSVKDGPLGEGVNMRVNLSGGTEMSTAPGRRSSGSCNEGDGGGGGISVEAGSYWGMLSSGSTSR